MHIINIFKVSLTGRTSFQTGSTGFQTGLNWIPNWTKLVSILDKLVSMKEKELWNRKPDPICQFEFVHQTTNQFLPASRPVDTIKRDYTIILNIFSLNCVCTLCLYSFGSILIRIRLKKGLDPTFFYGTLIIFFCKL